jgi:hypothetical protein
VRWHRRKATDREAVAKCAEATEALHKAQDDLSGTQERNQEITVVVKKVARYGEANNFAEMIRQAMGGVK